MEGLEQIRKLRETVLSLTKEAGAVEITFKDVQKRKRDAETKLESLKLKVAKDITKTHPVVWHLSAHRSGKRICNRLFSTQDKAIQVIHDLTYDGIRTSFDLVKIDTAYEGYESTEFGQSLLIDMD
jgi:hypothetical protein